MGIPYSKQINAAFDQVTPLVAAGFQVLETTKNISLLLLAIQILTVLLLALIQTTLLVVLITVNPDLESERAQIVTPVMKWVAGIMIRLANQKKTFATVFWILVAGACAGGVVGFLSTQREAARLAEAAANEQAEKNQAEKDDKDAKKK
ncbi:hypothetical protein C1H76_8690 [Elsinoe australis]|uniref:Uncharacterized protein n=1 Tax=Elsinoe australis TaxID=40998 RepID=A0A2P8AE50_9PEZI|nr:hypothetical protein B9Z65_6749 [Elsinoe australis]TKX19156.1 hypothetical protein C1H76_8690 [Elsinoe australis]